MLELRDCDWRFLEDGFEFAVGETDGTGTSLAFDETYETPHMGAVEAQ